MSVLEVDGLRIEFAQRRGPKLRAVDDVSFELRAGETLALVGESGSGKSTVVRALARLLRPNGGEIRLHGRPVGRGDMRAYRRQVQMVFQDPFASLNPSFDVAHHLYRPLKIHGLEGRRADDAVDALLDSVNLRPARAQAGKYPHELSGGQRQRVAIARALAPNPDVLLADEPVSMLDVSIRLDVLNLLDRLKLERNMALLYVTHDLATARHFSQRIMVMYRGTIVEQGSADDVILRPSHPYTQLLAEAAPRALMPTAGQSSQRIPRADRQTGATPSPGSVSAPAEVAVVDRAEQRETKVGAGCPFRSRCSHAMEICLQTPPLVSTGAEQSAKCWLYQLPGDTLRQ